MVQFSHWLIYTCTLGLSIILRTFHSLRKALPWAHYTGPNWSILPLGSSNLHVKYCVTTSAHGLCTCLLAEDDEWLKASVTRLGDLLDFGQIFKALGNKYLAQILHILR